MKVKIELLVEAEVNVARLSEITLDEDISEMILALPEVRSVTGHMTVTETVTGTVAKQVKT